jgi:hypothetical protein
MLLIFTMVCPIDGRPIVSAWLATISLQQPSQCHPKILIILRCLLVVSWMVCFRPRLCRPQFKRRFTLLFCSRSFPGNNSSSVVDVYNCLTEAWSTTSLPSTGGQMASTSLRVKLYVPNTGASVTKDIAMFAGISSKSGYFSTINIFDGTRWITDQLKKAAYSPLAATALYANGDAIAIFAGGENPKGASSSYVIRVLNFICEDVRFASSFFVCRNLEISKFSFR